MLLFAPILVILAAVPMLCGKVSPRLFGNDQSDATVDEAAWYRSTRVAGASFLMSGAIWLVAAVFLPGHFDSLRQERETIAFIGATAMAVALVVSVLSVEGHQDW